jgi:hypothetical protein
VRNGNGMNEEDRKETRREGDKDIKWKNKGKRKIFSSFSLLDHALRVIENCIATWHPEVVQVSPNILPFLLEFKFLLTFQ